MANEDVRAKVAELRAHQRAIQAASATQAEGWRRVVVAERRAVAGALGELSALIADRPPIEGTDALRRVVSRLRAALAEHQALWPAVSMDPADPGYQRSVANVRSASTDLDTALAGLDRPSRPHA